MKPAHERSFTLEDRLGEMRRQLAKFVFDGVRLSARDVAGLVEALSECRDEAILMACELSAKRWNRRSKADPLSEIVLAEIARPQTNLVLFPVAARPIPAGAAQLFNPSAGGAA